MKIEKISDIYEVLKGYTRKKRLVVAFANDSHSIEAVYMAVKAGLVEGILVGDTETIQGVCKENGYDESCFKIVHEPNDVRGAETAVEMKKSDLSGASVSIDRKSTRLNSSHSRKSRMPSSA